MNTPQAPIGSGFGFATTAQDAIREIDLSGKVAIVTGGYAGLGLETVRAFVSAGAKVIVPARDLVKARVALAELPQVTLEAMDLMDPASIDAFAERFLASGEPLHLLVNNAGIMAAPLVRDARGYESQFATNHLGHFQLTARLWPALVKAEGARVIALSSRGHRFAPVDFDDPNFEHRPYDRWTAYGQSKTANALFAVHLDALGKGHGIRAFSVHPGGIITDLARHMSKEELDASGYLDENGQPIIDPARNMKSVEQGAATTVWAATSPQLEGMGGVYCEDSDIAGLVDDGARDAGDLHMPFGVLPWATDPEAAERLWTLSEELTAVKI